MFICLIFFCYHCGIGSSSGCQWWKVDVIFGVILPSWLFLCLVALLLPSLTGAKLGFFAWDSLPFVSLSPILAVIVENAVIVVILLHGHV